MIVQRRLKLLTLYLIYRKYCVNLVDREQWCFVLEKGKDMNKDKARAGIYGFAAFYMLYIAMQLYKESANPVAIVFFVVAAIALIVFAIIMAKRITEEEKKASNETEKDDSLQ